jgi:hypothetical protein
MDGKHDTGYALLFSQPRMVQDLLRGFLPEEWIGWLDPATLERRDGGCHPDREGPLIWRLRWQGGSDWVYLLLRPQGEPDLFTALRLELDRGLLYHALLRRRRGVSARLPAVLPVVLYNGETRWTAPLDARELFLPLVPTLQRHVPSTRYLLLDAAAGPVPSDAGGNLVALLCHLERSRTAEEVDPLLARLAALLAEADDDPLRRAWSVFLGCSFLPRRFPGLSAAAAPGGVLA